MPAVGKITLDIKDYEAALARARKEGADFSKNLQGNFRDVSKGASKAGGIVSAMGSAAGSSFGKLGSVISALASGPVVALTAAFAALAALGVEIWDRMTLSAEEYAAKLDMVSKRADKNREAVEKQSAEDSDYMDRLKELASKEELSNEAKKEAAVLIKNLTSRYGDLGLSIDAITGQIKGADEAQKKFLEQSKKMRMQALREQFASTQKQAAKQADVALSAMVPGEQTVNKFGFSFRSVAPTKWRQRQFFNTESVATKLKYAETMRDNAKTKTDMENWQKVVELLEKQRDLQKQYNLLRESGAATEKEQAAAMQKKTAVIQTGIDAEKAARNALEKKTDDYYSNTISSLEKQLELQKLVNEGKLEEANRLKIINELEKQGITADSRVNTITALNEQLNAAKLTHAQGQQAASLYDRALRGAGRSKEADIRSVIEQARTAKGGELTEEERKRTLELFGLSQQLDRLAGGNFEGMAIQTNSLTARGGFQTGAAVPDAEKYARIQAENGKTMLSVVQRIETICRDFGKF